MSRLRILVLAPNCDPTDVSIPLVTYFHAAALADLHDVALVIGSPVEDRVRSGKANFSSIEVVRTPTLDSIFDWTLRRVFRYNFTSQTLAAFRYPFALAFEWFAWRQLRSRILAGEFDIVLRLIPMSPALPSPFAFLLRKGPIPFVIGPLNGGLPYVQGFSQSAKERQWISGFRGLYRFLPFARSTYRNSAAIIAASSQVYFEFSQYQDKLFFVPEPGIRLSLCTGERPRREDSAKIELIFVGGLTPSKACDLGLRAASSLLRDGKAHFSVVGDGAERKRLEQLVKSLEIERAVDFCGWLSHAEVLTRLRSSDVLVFPSVRDNGAGAVFEALACGAVPVVTDFGGPGDIVYPEVGRKVQLTNESDVVAQMEKVLTELVGDPELLDRLREQGMAYAKEHLTWDAKAQDTTRVLRWVLGRGPRPDFLPPKILAGGASQSRDSAVPYAASRR